MKKYIRRIFTVLAIVFIVLFVMNGFSFSSIISAFFHPNIDTVTIKSEVLDQSQKVKVYLPPDYDDENTYPVLYLLHGKDGNENSWFNGSFGVSAIHIDQVADRLIENKKIRSINYCKSLH